MRSRSVARIVGMLLVASALGACSKSTSASTGMFASANPDDSSCRATIITGAPRRPDATHPGMVWVPGGEFSMGSDNAKFDDARPWHRVRLHGFWIAKTTVTNAQFARFVTDTNYVTIAERKPSAKDFPGVPADQLVPGALVFTPPDRPVTLDDDTQWWSFISGANWRHPQGPHSSIAGMDAYPVVQIAYDDALAYAAWAHARLPTEAEFEYAERGGLSCKPYAWGDAFMPKNQPMANTFEGHFPDKRTSKYETTAPVGSFQPNGYGLYDMSGNVWEWTSDWYRADYYASLAKNGVAVDPTGPPDSDDPKEPGVRKHVTRGGSFLCTDQFCSRYEVGGRGETEPSSAANHVGFRVVRN